MEGLNNKIKLIIRQSYGFKTFKSLRTKLLACLFDKPVYLIIGLWTNNKMIREYQARIFAQGLA